MLSFSRLLSRLAEADKLMNSKERVTQVTAETMPRQGGEPPRRLTIAEARRKAFAASDKARQAQVAYAEEEAARWYDYRVEE